jgi:hypothetical protein
MNSKRRWNIIFYPIGIILNKIRELIVQTQMFKILQLSWMYISNVALSVSYIGHLNNIWLSSSTSFNVQYYICIIYIFMYIIILAINCHSLFCLWVVSPLQCRSSILVFILFIYVIYVTKSTYCSDSDVQNFAIILNVYQ